MVRPVSPDDEVLHLDLSNETAELRGQILDDFGARGFRARQVAPSVYVLWRKPR